VPIDKKCLLWENNGRSKRAAMLWTGMIPGFFMGNVLMWHDLLVALALLLVIEGIWPFLSPGSMREVLLMIAQHDNRSMRISGLVSMVIGVILLYVVN